MTNKYNALINLLYLKISELILNLLIYLIINIKNIYKFLKDES